ncbi:MAG: N-acetylneuraminate synthase family protein [Deltaproteobacteria bacterium]|nr:N-acetylneuraminate synthase family protein [Deltaproteobacteria bacterium]
MNTPIKTINLAGVEIGEKPFLIAEAGINHNGELNTAFKMIEVAKESGVDAVKFQTFKAEEFVANHTQTFTYKSQGKQITESMIEMFKRYEFSREEWFKIKKKCDEVGILFLSTPQNISDLELLLEVGIPAIKVGSDDFNNLPLLKEYKKTKLPIILSCGMADEEEIHQSLNLFENYPLILLLCTSEYPTPPASVNLKKLVPLRKLYPSVLLGFSDHTQGPLAASIATAYNTCVFEKHFTLNQQLEGPDHWFSENPEGLKEWVLSIRKAYLLLGTENLEPSAAEKEMKKIARRSIVSLRKILKDELFSLENIGLKRPGTGLPPGLYEKVIGKKAARNIEKNALIQESDFKNGTESL